MSMPSFPDNPPISRDDAVNLILASIAMEELGLSHVINTEGEKLQYILGTIPGITGPAATVEDVLTANESVRSVLDSAVQNQLFLKSKMENALAASPMAGPTGATGATGDTGPTGPTGTNVTATTSFAANTSNLTITVTVAGTSVALPDSQLLNNVTVDGTDTVFTVTEAGRYRLSYVVNTTLALIMGTRLIVSGSPNTASTVLPLIGLSNFSNEILLDMSAGTTVTLQLFGLAGTAILLPNSAGASLTIIRLS